MIEKERSPRPFSPATSAEPSEVAAIQQGGCGSWKGFGVTRRLGNWKLGESQEKYSSRHMPQTIWIASFHWSRDFSRSTWKAVCSIGVERPVPHSARPFERTSRVATFSAMRAGCVKPKGVRVTPNPRRICSVTCERAPSRTSGAGQWERPSRKWCSTAQIVWKPTLSASLICSIASR
jgi:hypothetical protein